jgi:hypothetical protein
MAISALAVTTGQTIKYRSFGELKVGKAQMGFGVLRLCGKRGFCFMSCGLHATRPSCPLRFRVTSGLPATRE